MDTGRSFATGDFTAVFTVRALTSRTEELKNGDPEKNTGVIVRADVTLANRGTAATRINARVFCAPDASGEHTFSGRPGEDRGKVTLPVRRDGPPSYP